MADAVARREARRKRILENSENRLRIISGLPKVNDSGDEPAKHIHTPLQVDEPKAPFYQSNPLATSSSSSSSSTDSLPLPASRSEKLEKPEVLTDHVSHSSDPLLGAEPKLPESTLQQSEVQKSPVLTIFATRLHLIGLALIVRLLLSSNYGFLFGESVFAPLVTVQLVKYWGVGSDSDIRNTGGMLNAALMLSGMPTWRINFLIKTLGMAKNFLEDFYIYFFTFVIFHVFLELCAT